jgi:hypothetical protein
MDRDGARWCGITATLALSLAGCGESVRHGGSEAAGTGDPRARPGQIFVVDAYGLPYANTPVLVNDAVVTTDANGYAPLPDVGAHYDVSVVVPPMAFTFIGLTTRAPIVRVTASTNGNGAASASVNILLPEELGKNQRAAYTAGVADHDAGFGGPFANASGAYAEAYWPSGYPTTLSAEAFIVDTDPVTGADLAFSKYAAESWTVTPGDTITWVPTFEPASFATKPIHVDVTLPPDAELGSYSVRAVEASGRTGSVASAEVSSVGDVLVPELPDTTYIVDADALTNDRQSEFLAEARGVHAGDHVTLAVSDGPLELAPDDGAVVTPDTDFAWTKGDESVDELVISTTTPNGLFTYVIATTDGSARLPDLSPLGRSFPAGGHLGWDIEAVPGVTSVDGLAAGASGFGWGRTAWRSATEAAP